MIAGEEDPNIWNNRALDDKFLKFGMVLGMGIVFSKSIAKNGYDLCWPLSKIQNGRQNGRQKQNSSM